jgi:PAS domain S-box-containing protein
VHNFPIGAVDAFLLVVLPVAAVLLGVALVILRRRAAALDVANASLAEERDRIRNALEGSALTIWDWDIASDTMWLNSNWKAMLGERPAETRISMTELLEVVHADDLDRVQNSGIEALRGAAEMFDAEYRVQAVDGSWRWIRTRGKVTVRDARGRATRASGTNSDITQRKLAEKSLAESEARFRALSSLSSDLYWEMDGQFHLVSWSAPAWSDRGDASIPRPLLDAPELTEADWESHRAVLEKHRAFRDMEVYQKAPEGGESWLSIGAVPVLDDHGGFRGYRGLARIITDRKLAEKRVRESESQLRQLVEFMPAIVVFMNREGRIVTHNRAYAEWLGLPESQVQGRLFSELVGEARLAAVQPHIERALAGEHSQYEVQRKGADGRPSDIVVLTSPLLGTDGEVKGVIVVGTDVTRLKEADRMKDHFVSVVSHELRTPLTSMRGSLGLLAGGVVGELPAEAKPLVDMALQNSDRLWRLVNDLLDIEKMAAGYVEFRVEAIAWRDLLREALEASRGLMQQFDVSFELVPLEDLRVRGDADRLAQVLSNLILNAAKFSNAGGVVSVGAERLPGGMIRTRIRDRGPGIPENFRPRLFQAFAQADTGDSRATGGSGLGLAICREIVTRLGGSIGFEDAPGGGTVFWFDLPDAQVAQ